MIELRHGPLRREGLTSLENPHLILARVIADLRLTCDGNEILDEPDFPVIDLVLQLSEWLERGSATKVPFSYTSIAAEDPGVIWFQPVDSAGWRLGSTLVDRDCPSAKPLESIRAASMAFIDSVSRSAASLGIDVPALMDWYRLRGSVGY